MAPAAYPDLIHRPLDWAFLLTITEGKEMFKWLASLFKRKETEPRPSISERMETSPHRYIPDAAVSRGPARTAKASTTSTRRSTETSRSDDYLHNPLNPMNPIGVNSPVYYDSTPSYSSHSSCSGSSSSSYDSGSSSSDSCSSSSSSD